MYLVHLFYYCKRLENEKSSLGENSPNFAASFEDLGGLNLERSGDEDSEKYAEKLRKDY